MIRKNIFSIIVALIISYLSLSDTDSFDKVSFLYFPGADKIVHFGLYFVFMSVIVFENRKNIGRIHILLLIAIIPFCFGALMEVLQSWLTIDRTGTISDLFFNFAGILLSVVICLGVRPFRKELIK